MIYTKPKFGAFGILGFLQVKYFYERRMYKHNMIHKCRNETFESTID